MSAVQLSQPILEAFLVLCPLARQEYEAVEHHARAHDRDPFDRLLEDDVDVSVHLASVRDPPEIYPVGIYLSHVSKHAHQRPMQGMTCESTSQKCCGQAYLMVRNQHHALRKIALQPPVLGFPELSPHTLVPTDYHLHRRPPVGHGGDDQAKLLLGQGHPCVEVVLVVPVQRYSNVLSDGDTYGWY
jgi:hypothetical protein